MWGESTGHRWITLTKASDAEFWCFLWSPPEQTLGQTIETPVFWDAIALIMTSLWLYYSKRRDNKIGLVDGVKQDYVKQDGVKQNYIVNTVVI